MSALTMSLKVGSFTPPEVGPANILFAVWVSRPIVNVPAPVIGFVPVTPNKTSASVDKANVTLVTDPEPEMVLFCQDPETYFNTSPSPGPEIVVSVNPASDPAPAPAGATGSHVDPVHSK